MMPRAGVARVDFGGIGRHRHSTEETRAVDEENVSV